MNSSLAYGTENKDDLLRVWNREISQAFTLSKVVHVLLFVIGTFGNSVIIIFYNFRLKGSKDDRYFIPILAVIDLLACVFSTWFDLLVNFFPVTFPDDVLCKSLLYVNYLTTQGSIFLLLLISIHRFRKICRPFQKQMDLKMKRICLLIIAIVTVVMCIPELVFYGKVPVVKENTNITGYICGPITEPKQMEVGLMSFTAVAMFIAVVSIAIMCILYSIILRYLLIQTRATKPESLNRCLEVSDTCEQTAYQAAPNANEIDDDQGCSPETNHEIEINRNQDKDELKVPPAKPKLKRSSGSKIRLSTRRLTFMFMTISLTNIISNIPTIIYIILVVNDPEAWFRNTYGFIQQMFQFMRAMRVVNHAFNPFLYGLFDGRFRDEIRSLLCRSKEI
ncbi:hypothetical protein FSP39_006275 [Pinctada imbricata]|uniref:G-protein coupled receptors family 1 profile domain-containing protein n=1 Tax=Pinctada imbricata TaxID=66713 RepID=A0AA88Y8A8_PINIB|nr:hypothetical protein FSP39_006275 [Pinctada imbricata]